jgi:hypothetical protein
MAALAGCLVLYAIAAPANSLPSVVRLCGLQDGVAAWLAKGVWMMVQADCIDPDCAEAWRQVCADLHQPPAGPAAGAPPGQTDVPPMPLNVPTR